MEGKSVGEMKVERGRGTERRKKERRKERRKKCMRHIRNYAKFQAFTV